MAPAKTIIALLFSSMQAVHAVRSDADTAALLSEVSDTQTKLQEVLERLNEGDSCEYATSHEVKTLGFTFKGGVNDLSDVQTKINELAKACHRIQKAQGKIEEYQGKLSSIEERLPALTESISKSNQEIESWKSSHPDITPEACKEAYKLTGIAGKSKRAVSNRLGGVSNWFKDLRASKDEKANRQQARADAKAAKEQKLKEATDISNQCKELDGLTKGVAKTQKSLDQDAKDKVSYQTKLDKQKAEVVAAQAAKDGAKVGAVEIAKKISDEITSNLGSGN